MKDEGAASWCLAAAPQCPGGWCITGVLLVHVCFNLGALFPAGALTGSFCVCRCSHSSIFTKKRVRCFAFLSLVLQQLWQQGRPRLERSSSGGGSVGQEQAGAPGGHERLRGSRRAAGPGLRPGGNLWKDGWMQGSTPRETGAGTELGQ